MIKNFYNLIRRNSFEGYSMLICILSLLGWIVSYNIFVSIILIIASTFIFVKKDPIYISSALFSVLFSYSSRHTYELPIITIIFGIVLIGYLIFFIIKRRNRIKLDHTMIFLIVASILSIVSILWNNSIPKDKPILYLLSLAWPLYLLIYILYKVSINRINLKRVLISLKYIGLLIALEVIYSAITGSKSNMLICEDYLGWGICNEAGILLCMLHPIVAYFIINNDNLGKKFCNIIISLLIIIGILTTGSRGAYLFGIIETIILIIILIKYSKRRILIALSLTSLFVATLAALYITRGVSIIKLFNNTFINGMVDNGRFQIWSLGFDVYNSNIFSSLLGLGMVSCFNYGQLTFYEMNVFVVYHSNFIQMLVSFGSIGMIFFMLHFIHKYKNLNNVNYNLGIFILISYVSTDLYGLIDNTYGMYYYMPIMLMLVAISSINEAKALSLF